MVIKVRITGKHAALGMAYGIGNHGRVAAMARRKQHGAVEKRSALGPAALQAALHKVTALCRETITATVTQEFNGDQIIDWLFHEHDVSIMRKALALSGVSSRSRLTYAARDSEFEIIPNEVSVYIKGWDRYGCLPISPEAVRERMDRDSMAPLFKYIKECQEIFNKFSDVRHVLTWLDANATISAIRYYWPAAAALSPGSFGGDMPDRFRDCPAIAPLLPLLRETAGTVASAKLIPAAQEPPPSRTAVGTMLRFTMRSRLATGGVLVTNEEFGLDLFDTVAGQASTS